MEGFEDDEYEGDLDGARMEVGKVKPIAKAFGLYPYNQPNYSMEMEGKEQNESKNPTELGRW